MTKLEELDQRSREIFRHIVDAYIETGAPVGSKNLSSRLGGNECIFQIQTWLLQKKEEGTLSFLRSID